MSVITNIIPVNSSRWERSLFVFALLIYSIWQINAIFHHGSWSQDFGAHMTWIEQARDTPMTWLTSYDHTRTNPPLYHFLASLVFRITHNIHSFEILGLLTLMLNMGALFLLYQIIDQFIQNPVMRMACMIFLLFLPFAMIQTVVIAADGLATILFITLIYLFLRLTATNSSRSFSMIVAGITVTLTIALTVKFTFMSLIPASILAYAILYRTQHLTAKRSMIGILAIILFPALFSMIEMHIYPTKNIYNLGLPKTFPNPFTHPDVNFKSIFTVNHNDKKLLSAPPYNYSEDGKTWELFVPYRYSYPALLHLGMFTDILNAYQYDPDDKYFGPRKPHPQKLMKLAVRSGLIFSICALISIPLMIFWCFRNIWQKQGEYWARGSIVALFSLAFYFNIVLFLPFLGIGVGGGYWPGGGHWLPRLVAPALLCFFILTFAFIEKVAVTRYRFIGWIFLFLVILQSCLHLSFLWPWGTNHPRPSSALIETEVIKL